MGIKFDPNVIGDTGLKQTGGYVYEEFLRELRGERGAKAFREMADNDPTIGAVLFAITSLLRQCEWRVQAVDETPDGEAGKSFVEEVINDMTAPFSSVIGEACTMFTYGYAPMEIIWKRRGGMQTNDPTRQSAYNDNRIGLRAISLRSQTSLVRWEIDEEDGRTLGMVQQPQNGGMVTIPAEKMLFFRTTDERNNPEGRSILRNAYRAWYFKKRIEEIEGIGIERDLAGLPVGFIPGEYFDVSADASQKQTLAGWKRLVTRIRRDQQEGIIIPSDRDKNGNPLFDLKLLSTGGSRQFDTSKVIDRWDRRIATSVLADFIFLGQQAVGSFALSSDKTALFATALGSYTKAIADVLNRQLLPRLWFLNGFDFRFMPSIVPGDLEKPNIGELGAYVQSLTAAGAPLFPDRDLENHLRSVAGLPLAAEEDSGIDTTDGMPMPSDEEEGM
jgi:hypothetical protein